MKIYLLETTQLQQYNQKIMHKTEKSAYPDITKNDLPEISLTALILGLVGGFFIANIYRFKFIGLPLNIIALCVFHFLEFYITAKYNPLQVTTNSYILRNGSEYTLATLISICECLLNSYVFHIDKKIGFKLSCIMITGGLMALVGQYFRSQAMITCGSSFNHTVQQEKQEDHVLITNGVYKVSRHPSYFGFFYWSIGCQLMCLNFVSFFLFTFILWNFFRRRITMEEEYLIKFFGQDYVKFRKSTGVGIPFIK